MVLLERRIGVKLKAGLVDRKIKGIHGNSKGIPLHRFYRDLWSSN